MTAIALQALRKEYAGPVAIPDLNLEIADGEFFTLLGPSGCGKTTLLRMIAGFNSIEAGTISFDGTVINDRPASERNIGMVFQNYALFPQMTAAKNVGFGLQTRKIARAEAEKRVSEALEAVRMAHLGDRLPGQMSGGQQQRVALARALVIQPALLLMDEPLSNLDAKLRVEMRDTIRQAQRDAGITTVYVTHDQEEAMAVSDRIAVMNLGVVQQVGTPAEIYRRPANRFVAEFIGKTNLLERDLVRQDGKALIDLGNGQVIDVTDMVDPAGCRFRCVPKPSRRRIRVLPPKWSMRPSSDRTPRFGHSSGAAISSSFSNFPVARPCGNAGRRYSWPSKRTC
jgi:iron(III) transport system ATP-binding protein